MSFEVAWKARAPKAPEPEFWERCKEQASLSNIPAWMIAENNFRHEEVDSMRRSR